MLDFLNDKLPIGLWAGDFVFWLLDHGGWFFDGMQNILNALIGFLITLVMAPHPLLWVVFLVLVCICLRRYGLALFTLFSTLLIINQGYWKDTLETVVLVMSSTFVCMLIGVPLGILSSRKKWVYTILQPILDMMQTIPTFVYLIPMMILFGIGMVSGLIATIVFALPVSLRLTYIGISSTPSHLKEVALSFGANPLQVLYRVELPYAMPYIMAGLTQTIMLSLSMVVVAALVGSDGLGQQTIRALNEVNVTKGFEVGLIIVLLAIFLDRLLRKRESSYIG